MLNLTDEQKKTRDIAIDLLIQFKEGIEISYYTGVIRLKNADGDGIGEDCCGNDECIEKEKQNIRKDIGKGKHLYHCYYPNDGDHERFELCCICGIYLNEFLTWVDGQELEYLEESTTLETKEDVIRHAFELSGILYSTNWSVDKDYNGKLAERITGLSKKVIKLLTDVK